MDDIVEREFKITEAIAALKDDIDAIQQPRSNFALENFVVAQHHMPGRQRMQCVLELQIKMFNARRAALDVRERELKIQQIEYRSGLGEVADQLNEVEAEKLKIEIEEINLVRLGNLREAECLYGILQKLPKYTREEYEAEERDYWALRLNEQIDLSLRPSSGNMEAVNQINRGILSKKPDSGKMAKGLAIVAGLLKE